jgi:hypothetical protein
MAAKKKKKDPEAAARNKRIAITTAVVLGAAGVFVSAGMGINAVDERAAHHITSTDPVIQINWGTDSSNHIWMPISERDRIERLVQSSVSSTKALSWQPLHNASKALASTGWVNAAPEARWTDDGTIIIEANWRIPAAVVRRGERDYLIDFEANVLPLDYPHDQSNQFVIHNPALPHPGTGNNWDEPEIRDALNLLVELQKHNLHHQVVGIDLGENREHGILQLLTDNSARVVFGGGPGRSRPAEMPTSLKIERLISVLNSTGRIDAGAMILDVRGAELSMQRHEG